MTFPNRPSAAGPAGLWLPLVTPFRDGALDETSLRRLVRHFLAQPLDGLILGATTGEGLALDADELARIVAVAAETRATSGSVMPLHIGLGGSHTARMVTQLERMADWPVSGVLVPAPHYSRPSQAGLLAHFRALADAAPWPLMLYNIPYRSGVGIANETMLALAAHPNIVGVKDCCADALQSFALLQQRPRGFSVLTGEDALFYSALAHGADGGILASAHVRTAEFAAIGRHVRSGDQRAALAAWHSLAEVPRLLFAEPNPAPIKHWLWRQGLIDSPEVRLPMTGISDGLAARIDAAMAEPRLSACA
ncbi:4-hydroxy-tetrahydrodipicolinate synthase [Zavarzinia sp. CC-PAN008]|uniref:4-hydroxy-tetrahydrodipicolinate synthase n=1 Tax=Zavarzinia sp. CC-PAN008 TaxID=3243332 RepID=UPI003F74ABF1